MMNTAAAGDLVMQWVEVQDARGRSSMEARWVVVSETTAPIPVALAHTQAA